MLVFAAFGIVFSPICGGNREFTAPGQLNWKNLREFSRTLANLKRLLHSACPGVISGQRWFDGHMVTTAIGPIGFNTLSANIICRD